MPLRWGTGAVSSPWQVAGLPGLIGRRWWVVHPYGGGWCADQWGLAGADDLELVGSVRDGIEGHCWPTRAAARQACESVTAVYSSSPWQPLPEPLVMLDPDVDPVGAACLTWRK